jgi:hypothetical protein
MPAFARGCHFDGVNTVCLDAVVIFPAHGRKIVIIPDGRRDFRKYYDHRRWRGGPRDGASMGARVPFTTGRIGPFTGSGFRR